MKLSQPKSARTINTARVLTSLRTGNDLSRAELSRILELNKVSVGEIVDELVSKNIVKESEKQEVLNGRKPTILEIIPDCHYVLAVNISGRFITTALCDVAGNIIKLERVPSVSEGKVEEFVVNILKSCMRTVKLVPQEKILGCGITISAKISKDGQNIEECQFLPWKDIPLCDVVEKSLGLSVVLTDSATALVKAEKLIDAKLKTCSPTMYIDWGSTINMALVSYGKVMSTSYGFGHVKVCSTGLCSCGSVGCLEANASSWAISGNPDSHLKDLWEEISVEALEGFAKAVKLASQITGATEIIIGGEGSTISAKCLNMLCTSCRPLSIKASALGEKAVIQSAAQTALDKWFYMSSMLDEVSQYI